MDRYVHALVPKIRLQVELRSPLNFHEAAMYVEHADVVITHVIGQDMCKPWQKSYKGGSQQQRLVQVKHSGESSA